MWTIIKFDKKKLDFLKEDFTKKLGKDFIIYNPKLSIQKYKNNKKHTNTKQIIREQCPYHLDPWLTQKIIPWECSI